MFFRKVPIEFSQQSGIADRVFDGLAFIAVESRLEKGKQLDPLRISGRIAEGLAQIRTREVGDYLLESKKVEGFGLDDGAADRPTQLLAMKVLLQRAVG